MRAGRHFSTVSKGLLNASLASGFACQARRLFLLATFAATVGQSPPAGNGFVTMSMFVGERSRHAAAHGEETTRACARTTRGREEMFPPDSCDTKANWHSQSGQDRVVAEGIFQGKRGGFFIDLAANHPFKKSNSRALERDYGWSGLCIDGNEQFLMLLLKHRMCKVVGAIVASESDADVQYRHWLGSGGTGSTGSWQHALSGIVGFDNKANLTADSNARYVAKGSKVSFVDTRAVTTRLIDLLRYHNAPTTIDYLSLDVEGAEEAVLRGFPFHVYTFLAMSIERPSEVLQRSLIDNGYVRMAGGLGESYGDVFFLHRSLPGGVEDATKRIQEVNAKWVPGKRWVS